MKIESFKDIEIVLKPSILPLSAIESYSLHRIKKLMEKLGNPQNKIKIIHVAGTSGKTSTSYYIAEMLRLSGYKIGLSASPHIIEMNERLQIDLVPLEENKFCKELSSFLEILSKLSIKPTYFELFTAFAYWYFNKIGVDYAVMETGLGGKLDATNVVDSPNKICAITDIGLDHTEILGKTLAEIANQKAGIIQQNNIVIMNSQSSEISNIISRVCTEKNAKLNIINPIDNDIGLPDFQWRNFRLALAVAGYILKTDKKFELTEAEITSTAKIIIPGRIEIINYKNKQIILDGAHNHQKMDALINSLNKVLGDEKVCLVLAVGKNKTEHLLQITQAVSRIAGRIIVTSFGTTQDYEQKSLNPDYVGEYFPDLKVEKYFNLNEAIDRALESNEKTILITGSLYLVSSARKILVGNDMV